MNERVEENVVEMEEWQACVYLFIARLFRQAPDDDFLKAIAEERILDGLFVESDGNLFTLTNELISEVEAHKSDFSAYAAELDGDYHKLFIGPGPLLAPPWESVYRSKERLVFGEQTLAVRECYQSFGLASKQQNKEPDDHIALELEFMAWLCNQSETAAQQQFLNNHILKWVPLFCSDVAKGADTSFYRIVAELTGAWVEATTKAQYQK